jgi:hypothetical protein
MARNPILQGALSEEVVVFERQEDYGMGVGFLVRATVRGFSATSADGFSHGYLHRIRENGISSRQVPEFIQLSGELRRVECELRLTKRGYYEVRLAMGYPTFAYDLESLSTLQHEYDGTDELGVSNATLFTVFFAEYEAVRRWCMDF